MLQNTTVAKLHEMKLGMMAASFQEQLNDSAAGELSFQDRFGLLVDGEWGYRNDNRLKRQSRNVDVVFPEARLEDIEY